MSFLDPLLLLGLAAMAIPLLLHLLDRRHPRRVPFAAIEFILRSQRRSARRFRLRQLLLLLARMALCGLLALALARPQWLTQVPNLGSSGPPTATAVVLDDSLSMQYLDDQGQPLFEQARSLAREVFAGQRVEDGGALLLASGPLQGPVQPLLFDRTQLDAAVVARQPGFRGTDLAGAVGQAAQLLAASPLPQKRIVVVSDLRAAGFEAGRLPRLTGEPGQPALRLVPLAVGPPEVWPNRAVVDVTVTPAADQGPLAYRITAHAAAFGPQPQPTVEVRLEVNGEPVNAGTLTFQQGRGSKEFLHTFATPGIHRGAVLLSADRLPADDRREFTLLVQRQVRALLVNGDPSPSAQHDELFYLERALRPGEGVLSRLQPTLVTVPLLSGANLAEFDVVVLANVSGLSPELVAELERFVRRGGGLLLTAGDNVEVARYNDELGELLPRPLRDIYRTQPGGGVDPVELGPARGGSPILTPLLGPGGEGLRAARFHSFLLLEPGGGETTLTTHLTFSTGAPALVERKLGRGAVALLTTTVDRDWTDLPIRTGFLPLMQELLFRLAGARESGQQPAVLVGQPLTLPRPAWVKQVQIQPWGRPGRTLEGDQLPPYRTLTLPDTDRPGVLKVTLRGGDGQTSEEARAVVIDPLEADTTPLDPQQLAALRGQPEGDPEARERTAEQAYNLWPWALLFLVILLLTEALLLTRREAGVPEEIARSGAGLNRTAATRP